jgi:hypothetical protein
MTNIGAEPLTLTGVTTSGDFTLTTSCGATLAAGASCAAAVTFAPTAAGVRTSTVSIADNATGAPHTITLTGTGVAAPSCKPASRCSASDDGV